LNTHPTTDEPGNAPHKRDRSFGGQVGRVRGIAHRPVDGEPMVEAAECDILVGRGISTENRKPGKREVTFLSAEAWANTCRDLGAVLPWQLRRANLLIEGIDLSATIGRTLAVGDAQVRIHAETTPCGLMEKQFPGLCAALVPECRGGVYGQVLSGGTVKIGDPVAVLPANHTPTPA
jgi:MOSC domain-containing protein YiiM